MGSLCQWTPPCNISREGAILAGVHLLRIEELNHPLPHLEMSILRGIRLSKVVGAHAGPHLLGGITVKVIWKV